MVVTASRLLGACLMLVGFVPNAAHAQELNVSPEKDVLERLSDKPQNILDADAIGDQVNYQTGALTFRQVDIDLPGQGPNITISRTFDVGTRTAWNWRHDLEFADWDMEIPSVSTNTTMGSNDWKVVGSNPTARCTQFGPAASVGSYTAHYWWRGAHLEIPGIGRQELMQRAPENTAVPAVTIGGVAQTFNIVTKNHWAITCLSTLKDGVAGEGFLAVSPQGTKYWFDKMVYYFEAYDFDGDTTSLYPGSRWKASLLVTRIEDRHGNFLTYSYTGNKLTGISSSDGRALQIAWTANRGKPGSSTEIYHIDKIISLPGTPLQRTWQYSYLDRGTAQGTNTQPRWDLRTLTLPDQSSWFFDIGALPNSCVDNQAGCYWHYPNSISGSIRTPSGLTGTFTLSSSIPFRNGQFAVSPPSTAWANASLQLLELDPITFQSPFLREKTLSGPGVQQTWSYGYSGAVLQAGQLAFGRFAVKNPDDTLDLIFVDTAWGSPTEGQVVRQEKYNGPVTGYVGTGPALRIDTFQYVSMPNKIGIVPRTNSNNLGEEFAWPLKIRTTTVDGATFNYRVNTFDVFARPLIVDRWSEGMVANFGRTDVTEYYDNPGKWVLGQVSKVTNVNTTPNAVLIQIDYDPTSALPVREYWPGTTALQGNLQKTMTYYSDGNLATVKDGNNNVITLSSWYRGIPRIIQYPITPEAPSGATRGATVNDNGWVTAVTDENDFITGYGYDAMGRLASIVYPTNDSTAWTTQTFTFTAVQADEHGLAPGHWTMRSRLGDRHVNTYYDAMWRPVLEEQLDYANIGGTLSQTVKRYDASGRLAFQSYPTINVGDFNSITQGARTTYDALGRVVRAEQDSELGVLATTTEYLAGFKTRITPPKGQPGNAAWQTTTTYMAYDAPSFDLPVTIQEPEGRGTTITRDVFGKPTALSRGGNGVTATRYYVYQADQQLCKAIEPEAGATVYGYDFAGNLTKSASGLQGYGDLSNCNHPQAWASGRAVDRTYDARHRMTQLMFPDGRGNQWWQYTPDGKPDTITTWNGLNGNGPVVNHYVYNKRRMLTSEAVEQPNWYAWGISYVYDTNANLATQIYPTGFSINYAPNALGQATQASSYATGVQYYPNGAIKQFTYGNGIVHTMVQNARQLPQRSTDSGGTLDLAYSFDANANVNHIWDYAQDSGNGFYGRWMTYDGLDRLTDAGSCNFGGDCWHRFTYDALDNLKSWKLPGVKDYAEYIYDAKNQLTNIKDSAGATVVGLGYDVQGNLTNNNGFLYQFDYGNRLRSNSLEQGFMYDGHGRRASVTRGSMNPRFRKFAYAVNGQLLYEENTANNSLSEHVYLGGSLIATRSSISTIPNGQPTVTYAHTDALGSPVAKTNQAGVVQDRTSYEPYGAAINKPTYEGIGYTGHVQDGASGLTYMQQRYYDPAIGRFLSADPVEADSNTGSNFNRFWYANNNPYSFTDPDGRAATIANGNIYIRPENPAMPRVSFRNNVGATGVSPDRMFFHDYIISTPSKSNDPGAVAVELARNPTPGIQDYSTPSGTLNNVGHLPFQLDFGVNMVRSFTVPSPDPLKYTDVIVNYTVAGAHTLEEGFVMQFGQILPSGQISLVTYGEGNAFVQGNWDKSLWGPPLRKTWEELHEEINENLSTEGE